MWRFAHSPMPSRSSSSCIARRSLAAGPGQRPGLGRQPHQHDLLDGDREAPVDRLELGHVADARSTPAAGCTREADRAVIQLGHPEHRPEQRGLARAARPDDPGELARIAGSQRDPLEDRPSLVAAGEIVKLDERAAQTAGSGMPGAGDASRGQVLSTATAERVGRIERVERRRIAAERRRPSAGRRTAACRRRCSRASRAAPGGSSSRSCHNSERRSRGRSAPGPGSGTPPSRRWLARRSARSGRSATATSRGDGSAKSDGWIAPITSKP